MLFHSVQNCGGSEVFICLMSVPGSGHHWFVVADVHQHSLPEVLSELVCGMKKGG